MNEETPIHSLTLVPFDQEADEGKSSWCGHRRSFNVSHRRRTVTCAECDSEVDPYLAISRIADYWSRWETSRKHCEAKAKAAEQRLADLERDEKNCRSRLAGLYKAIAEELPADLAEALALLRSRQNYTRAWEARRAELLAKHGGGP